MNIHRSGVLTALTWLVPYETAAILARSVYVIQPCTMSLHAKPHMPIPQMTDGRTSRKLRQCQRLLVVHAILSRITNSLCRLPVSVVSYWRVPLAPILVCKKRGRLSAHPWCTPTMPCHDVPVASDGCIRPRPHLPTALCNFPIAFPLLVKTGTSVCIKGGWLSTTMGSNYFLIYISCGVHTPQAH